MQDAKRPWLSVYGGKLSVEPIAGSLGDFLEGAAERYRDNVALTGEGGEFSYGESCWPWLPRRPRPSTKRG